MGQANIVAIVGGIDKVTEWQLTGLIGAIPGNLNHCPTRISGFLATHMGDVHVSDFIYTQCNYENKPGLVCDLLNTYGGSIWLVI